MRRPKTVLGLTGSIGMGKSTTLAFFNAEGADVWDADAAVARLYQPGTAVTAALEKIVPEAIEDSFIDRDRLRTVVQQNPDILRAIERIVHPHVAADRAAFLASTSVDVAVCDIPLLFETGAADDFDAVVVVSAPAEVQRARVLARPGMTPELLDTILAKQMPDAEKRKRADFLVDTGQGLDAARQQVADIMNKVREGKDA